MFRYLALCLVAAWGAFGGSAQEVRYALLIGNTDYPAELGALAEPAEDVDRIRHGLITAGFPAENIEVLQDAARDDMALAIASFSKRVDRAGAQAVGFFYYSGHCGAATVNGTSENFLIPAGSSIRSASELPALAISVNKVARSLASARAEAGIIVIDACQDKLSLVSTGDERFYGVMTWMKPPRRIFVAFGPRLERTTPQAGAFSRALARMIGVPGVTARSAIHLAQEDVLDPRIIYELPVRSSGDVGDDVCFAGCSLLGAQLSTEERIARFQVFAAGDEDLLHSYLRRFPDKKSDGALAAYVLSKKERQESMKRKFDSDRGICERLGAEFCHSLASDYANGWGVEKDAAEAARLNRDACNYGRESACFDLALSFLAGNGVSQDDKEGDRLLRVACHSGLGEACHELERMDEESLLMFSQ